MKDKFIYNLSVGMVIFGLLLACGGFFLGNAVLFTDAPAVKTNIDWFRVVIGGLIIALGFYLNSSNRKK
jgi:uncharacterized membrane protein YedE/YeeE